MHAPPVRSSTVRRARPTDATGIAAVHVASWQAAYRGILPTSYLARLDPRRLAVRWRDAARRPRDGCSLWVAERDEVIGFARTGPCADPALVGFAGEVFMLYVHPHWWSGGHGRRLLEWAVDDLEAQGYFWAVVGVLADNAPARAFYERTGFSRDGASSLDRIGGAAVRVVRYARPINAHPLLARGLASLTGG